MNKMMDMKEFVDEGYLQEVNRKFLHPHGMALCVTIDEHGNYVLHGILDSRDDPEGFNFTDEVTKGEKFKRNAANVSRLWNERAPVREAALGYMTQSIR